MSKISVPFVRSAYNYDTMQASNEAGLLCEDPSLAQQHSKDDCDINLMLERMARGVQVDLVPNTPRFGDFSTTANDYHTAMNTVIAAQEAFDGLPPKVRAKFENDPEKLLAFIGDDKNRDEAIELGLLNAPAQPQTVDLSTGSLAALTGSKASEPVGKSGKGLTSLLRRSNANVEGGEGDE